MKVSSQFCRSAFSGRRQAGRLRFGRRGWPQHPFRVAAIDRRPPMPTSPASTSAAPIWIEILRGRTQYPRRPLEAERFLIGAGSSCHLQLGGEGMPFLHSLIVRTADGVLVEAFVPWPELRVNGDAVKSAALQQGDVVSIGGVEFAVHLESSLEIDHADPLLAPVPLDLADAEAEDIATLSASELVARIEAEEQEVEAFESRRQVGAAAILAAIRQHAPIPREVAAPLETDAESVLLADLSSLSQELEERLAALRQQEDVQRTRAESLLSAQDKLAEQLRLAAQSLAREQTRTRASA